MHRRLHLALFTKTGNYMPSYLQALINKVPPGSIIITFKKDAKILEFAKARNIHCVVIHPHSESYDYKMIIDFAHMLIAVGGFDGQTVRMIVARSQNFGKQMLWVNTQETLNAALDALVGLGWKADRVPTLIKEKPHDIPG